MFRLLEEINSRPKPFQFYTAKELWTDEHTSKQMLDYHLNDAVDLSSRNSEFIDRSVKWMVSRFCIGEGKAVADFGCGPGLYAIRLARTGAAMTGIDFSERSIGYAKDAAKGEGLSIDYVNEDYLTFETSKRFDLITMIFCDFCALSPDRRRSMLAKFHGMLNDGGSVLMDVHSLKLFEQTEESAIYELNQLHGFWSPNPYYGFVTSFKYEDEKVLLDKYTIVEADRTRTVFNWIQCFTPASIKAELEGNGFEVEDLFADVTGAPIEEDSNEIAVVARKSA